MMKTVITAISAENMDNKENNDASRRCELVLSLLEFDRAIIVIPHVTIRGSSTEQRNQCPSA